MVMKSSRVVLSCLVSIVAVLILPVGAKACLVSVTITATDGTNTAIQKTFSGESVAVANGGFECVLVNEYDPEISIFDGDIEIGAITSLKLTIDLDPEVGVEFGVRAGSSPTTFSILPEPPVVSFDPLVNPIAYASAGITLTDRNNNGATITGLFPGGKTHQARYNGSTVFANLVGGFSIGSGTQTDSEAKPFSGSQIISGTVSSIESEFNFTLSARDSASGTSTFAVEIPEPATITLLGLAGAIVLRRRRG